ncbi:MAG: hypothetical protein RLZZ241_123 [Bacteroidota bacterium]
MKQVTAYLTLIILGLPLHSQQLPEVNPPNHIRSIVFKGETADQFPIVQLGESILLEFDDLTAIEQDYYYKIIHCNYNWTPSQLLKSQYLNGRDNQRITNYGNSYSTLQSYSHYQLRLPNSQVSPKVAGNYILEIYNAYGELQFSRRFAIYQDLVKVAAQIRRPRKFEDMNSHQSVQFSVKPSGIQLINPKQEVKAVILQNFYWPNAIYDLAPQFTMGTELVYKYDRESSFWGGNEFLYFDTSDLRAPTAAISSIAINDLYEHYLFPNSIRRNKPYTFFPDINGDFVIRTLQGRDASREAEYTRVHFALPYTPELGLKQVYIFGKFNNYALTDENRLVLNPDSGYFEGSLVLKQGFYNYKYLVVDDHGTADLNAISGTYHVTENQYTILIYYRQFGDLYDSLIGIGTANSTNMTN